MLPRTTSQAFPTPDTSLVENRKRKRDVLSCLDCRRRKLKCDRGFPACSRCEKGGLESSCTYKTFQGDSNGHHDEESNHSMEEDRLAEKRVREEFNARPLNGHAPMIAEASGNVMQSQPTGLPQTSDIKRLENRLATLEGIIARMPIGGDFHGVAESTMKICRPKQKEYRASEPETHLFKGRGVRTQFYGASNPISLLTHFPEVRTLMKEVHPSSSLERLQHQCGVLAARLKESLPKAPSNPNTNLLELVPNRAVVDRSLRLYFDTFEMTYRILHRATFWKEYELFWRAPDQVSSGFLPVLLLIMAIVRCMSPKETLSFDLDGSSVRTEAIKWIQACDVWLEQQSQKHRFLAMYQVMCLRRLAALANCLKTKEAYIGAESLLTYFKAAGMHRDPSMLGERCSPYEHEMRRRLWATAMELELEASIDRGAPSSLTAVPIDCPPPLNVNDEFFNEGSSKLPEPRPSEDFTETSFLGISSKSLSLRISLCSLINDPNSNLRYEDVMQHEQQINDCLKFIPEWKNHNHTQVSTLLELQLRQFILLIHTPFARRTGSSQNRYSRMICFETSKRILDQHFKLISLDNFSISLVREDVFRAALSICHNAFICTLQPDDMFFQGILANFSSMLDTALKILEEECMRRGRGFQPFWFVSAACSLVQSRLEPGNVDAFKLLATERAAKLYQKVLAFQEGLKKPSILPPGASLLQSETGFNAPASWFYSANVLGFTNNETTGSFDDLVPFDTSDWTLDNLWPLEGQCESNILT